MYFAGADRRLVCERRINLKTILEALREILGSPNFYITDGSLAGSWDYGAMIEYFVGALILCIVVASIFRFVGRLVPR